MDGSDPGPSPAPYIHCHPLKWSLFLPLTMGHQLPYPTPPVPGLPSTPLVPNQGVVRTVPPPHNLASRGSSCGTPTPVTGRKTSLEWDIACH